MEQGTPLPLEYWRFDKEIELITKANGDYVRLGTSIYPDDPSTIEWKLQEHEKMLYNRKSGRYIHKLQKITKHMVTTKRTRKY